MNTFYLTTPIYYINARPAPRACVHHHHGRRDVPLSPAGRWRVDHL